MSKILLAPAAAHSLGDTGEPVPVTKPRVQERSPPHAPFNPHLHLLFTQPGLPRLEDHGL
jgi:hypothetical protein